MKTLVLFGASGDLAKRKIYPAIHQNYERGFSCKYIGFGRTKFSNVEFRDIVKNSVGVSDKSFLSRFFYVSGSYDELGLKNLVGKVDVANVIYYFAIPNRLEIVQELVGGLKANNLISKKSQVVIEKPFGSDYSSAKRLLDILNKSVPEKNIFLIDHFLAKSLVRNLITLRFANPVFENNWSSKYIDKVEIEISENEGIGGRGEYYDKTGAIRDMIQNHGLQLLTLVTMDQPKSFNSSDFYKQKEKIARSVRMFGGKFKNNINIGQYKDYKNEKFVDKKSQTETYVSMNLEVNNDRWRGVPIKVYTGKKLKEKKTQIRVYFKGMNNCLWNKSCGVVTKNILKVDIFPDSNVSLSINTESHPSSRLPGSKDLLLNFNSSEVFDLPYSNALRDVYNKERSYMPSKKEVLYSWMFIDKVERYVERRRGKMLRVY